ncbi:uncharacterized protein MELLADRAFT_107900 [Melampsora larici-populina 98AG31]|uniref:Uncharacterized protein n=1 Tax=Melampsora larici-populina (strain 98AG31 / pathotype 3-4-7) TaxID=747676 RepID=F4RRB5_MELLP|nr:uncharacterized protein MELLADRAFT_107900 [Melampsora larici-populina 98AG31]EGG04910.1 hypothetical protein MELLADRAFT_107900 [Melampsora larici-populina 98AG31]
MESDEEEDIKHKHLAYSQQLENCFALPSDGEDEEPRKAASLFDGIMSPDELEDMIAFGVNEDDTEGEEEDVPLATLPLPSLPEELVKEAGEADKDQWEMVEEEVMLPKKIKLKLKGLNAPECLTNN